MIILKGNKHKYREVYVRKGETEIERWKEEIVEQRV